jgi:hypothetical protein
MLLMMGYLGFLSPIPITIGHLLTCLIILITGGWDHAKKGVAALSKGIRGELISTTPWEKFILSVLAALFILLGVSAMTAPALNYDSLWYRLPRLGYWLQEGNIRISNPLHDPPLYYYPLNAAFLQFWFMQPFSTGYPLVQMAQWFSGIVACLAITGSSGILFPQICWSKRFIVVSSVCLASPVFLSQMMTSQTDLITASVAAIACYLLLLLLDSRQERPQFPILFGLTLGLLAGAKLTGIILLPGILVALVIGILDRFPNDWVIWRRNLVLIFASSIILPMPRMIENYIEFGHPLAPVEGREINGTELSLESTADKFMLNGFTTLLQSASPQSTPCFFRNLHISLLTPVLELLPEPDNDRYIVSRPRKSSLEERFTDPAAQRAPSEAEGLGVIVIVLILISSVAAIRNFTSHKKRRKLLLILALFACSFTTFALISSLLAWFPYNVRFHLAWQVMLFVLSPAVLFLGLRPKSIRYILAILLCIAVIQTGEAWSQGLRIGLDAARNGGDSPIFYNQKLLLGEVDDGHTVVIANGYSSVNSGYLRTGRNLVVRFFGSVPKIAQVGPSTIKEIMKDSNSDFAIGSTNIWSNRAAGVRVRTVSLEGDYANRRGSFIGDLKSDVNLGFVRFENRFFDPKQNAVLHTIEIQAREVEQTASLKITNEASRDRKFILISGDRKNQIELGAGDSGTLPLDQLETGNNKFLLVVLSAIPAQELQQYHQDDLIRLFNPISFDYQLEYSGVTPPLMGLEEIAREYAQ